jgi:hypothetical protein
MDDAIEIAEQTDISPSRSGGQLSPGCNADATPHIADTTDGRVCAIYSSPRNVSYLDGATLCSAPSE